MNIFKTLQTIKRKAITPSLLCALACVGSQHVNANHPFDEGKVWFLLGQDSGSVTDFDQDVLKKMSFPYPDGTSIYTNLVYIPELGQTAPLQGFYQTNNFGGGRVDFTRQLNTYKGALAVGLYLVDTSCTPSDKDPSPELRNLPLRALAGDPEVSPELREVYRKKLDEMIDYFKSTKRDVLLRIGYEFDGPWNCYTPDTYKQGFRAIKQRIAEKQADNIYTVWQSATYPFIINDARMKDSHNMADPNHLNRWYPGDDAVDIVSLSFFIGKNFRQFALPEGCVQDANYVNIDPREAQNKLLTFARQHNKPAMISESAPQGLNTVEKFGRCVDGFDTVTGQAGPREAIPKTEEEIWDLWFEDYFDFIRNNRDVIKATTYVNANWAEQPLWRCVEGFCPQGYWGDTRIQFSPLLLERFGQALREPHFKANPLGVLDFTPTIPFDGQRLEAEYAQTPQMWANGNAVGGYGTPITDTERSNQGAYIIFSNGGPIEFQKNVTAGRRIKIRYATTTESSNPDQPFSFGVHVDGKKVADIPFTNTGLEYVDTEVFADVKEGSTIRLNLNSGFVIWFDYIEVTP